MMVTTFPVCVVLTLNLVAVSVTSSIVFVVSWLKLWLLMISAATAKILLIFKEFFCVTASGKNNEIDKLRALSSLPLLRKH